MISQEQLEQMIEAEATAAYTCNYCGKPHNRRAMDGCCSETCSTAYAVSKLEDQSDSTVNPLSIQHGGDHYTSKGIQPIQYILANNLSFCEGNVVKYVTRYKDKNGLEDLKKARHYLDFLINDIEKDT